jgi:hypothetical protein
LVDQEQLASSDGYTVDWDGTDNGGKAVASGVYFCRLAAGATVEVRKLVLLK